KDITSGASSDIQHATKLARAMVYDWGMSKKIGFLSLGASNTVFIGRDYQSKNDFSEKLAGIADDEIMTILNDNYKRAQDILNENVETLHEMAKLLLARETIYKEEVDMIMAGKKTEEIVEIMQEKERKQKEKEARLKAEKDKLDKLENFKKKINEGENLIKMGIITEEELDQLKKEYIKFEKSLNEAIEGKVTEEKAEKPETEAENVGKVAEVVETEETAKVEDTQEEKPSEEAVAADEAEDKEENENKNDEEG
ncbi:MAG: hypothetical protein J6K39_02025, partial [Clostridia bacterium]|nr:hypothetical protein [Clostridia bacterium]